MAGNTLINLFLPQTYMGLPIKYHYLCRYCTFSPQLWRRGEHIVPTLIDPATTRMAFSFHILCFVALLGRNVDAVVLGNVAPDDLPDPRIIILGATGLRSNLFSFKGSFCVLP